MNPESFRFFFPEQDPELRFSYLEFSNIVIPKLLKLASLADSELADYVAGDMEFAQTINSMYFNIDSRKAERVPLLEQAAWVEMINLRDSVCQRLKRNRVAQPHLYLADDGMYMSGYGVTLADGQLLFMNNFGYCAIPRFMISDENTSLTAMQAQALRDLGFTDLKGVDWQKVKDEIRRQARAVHPDFNPGNPEAEAKMKQVNRIADDLDEWLMNERKKMFPDSGTIH